MIKKIIEDNNYMLTSKEERDERLTNLIKQSLAKQLDKRIKYHEKEFNRYDKEAKSYTDSNQVTYSTEQAIEEMHIIDELKLIKKGLTLGDKNG